MGSYKIDIVVSDDQGNSQTYQFKITVKPVDLESEENEAADEEAESSAQSEALSNSELVGSQSGSNAQSNAKNAKPIILDLQAGSLLQKTTEEAKAVTAKIQTISITGEILVTFN